MLLKILIHNSVLEILSVTKNNAIELGPIYKKEIL